MPRLAQRSACVQDLEVIITDIDALVLREPFAFMNRWRDAGFLTTSDHLGNTTDDGGLEDHRGIHTGSTPVAPRTPHCGVRPRGINP